MLRLFAQFSKKLSEHGIITFVGDRYDPKFGFAEFRLFLSNWESKKRRRGGIIPDDFCLKKIEFVALAIKISSYIIFELSQNSMHFMKKSHR